MKKEIDHSTLSPKVSTQGSSNVEVTYLRTQETSNSPADMSPETGVDSVPSSLPTFMDPPIDNTERAPGAFHVGGRPASSHESDSVSSQSDDAQSPPVLSAEIASGAVQSELRELRNAFANVPRAQRLSLGGENRDNNIDHNGSPHSCATQKKQICVCCSILAVLVIVALVIGITFGLQKTKRNGSTVALVPLAPKNSTPSSAQTTSPSIETTAAPSSSPIDQECILWVAFACNISYYGRTFTCEDYTPTDTSFQIMPCQYTPFPAGLLYNGGDCTQSDSGLNFTCNDTAFGPPPIDEGEQSYIVVTDASGKGFIYFEGYVAVGDIYYIESPELKLLDDGFHIMIFLNEREPSTLLQEATYNGSLCSSREEFSFRFGASQLIEYENEVQGKISSFYGSSYHGDIFISFVIYTEPHPLTLQRLTARTNFAGFVDFTDQVAGLEVLPENLTVIDIPVTLDLTERRRYTILFQVTAIEGVTGDVCTATEFHSFYAGGY